MVYYIDECGVQEYLYREYGYASKGVIVRGKTSGRRFKRTNIVAAKCCEKVVAPMCYDCMTDSVLFEWWFQNELLKTVPKGSFLVMDNTRFHRKKRLEDLAREAECIVLFLPAYSPDLNPIEKFWAWLKQKLRSVLKDYDVFLDALCDCFQLV